MQLINYKTQRAKLGQEKKPWNYLVPHNTNPLTSHEDRTYPKDEKNHIRSISKYMQAPAQNIIYIAIH